MKIANLDRSLAMFLSPSRRFKMMRFSVSLGAVICALLLTQCEVPTTVKITNDNPPVFKLSGSGSLVFFGVFELVNNNERDLRTIWRIKPKSSVDMREIPPIKYGEVPEGFFQLDPEGSTPAPPLVEGQTYEAGGPADEASGGYTVFVIRDGRAVVLRTFGI
jgi:hypothetical protein